MKKLSSNREKQSFYWFLGIITLVNFLQAIFTEINEDEAYYFLYAKNLDWGYYDHPPMVALLIFLSSIFFDGNLSVRFMTVLLFSTHLYLIWKLLLPRRSPENVKYFFIISMAMVMFNAYGFITTPDVPLLFFTTLFLWMYSRFIKEESLVNTIFLGIFMAAMMYSKYQGAFVIFFVLLSNPKLFTRKMFYVAALTAIILLLPHIFWHYRNDFPSLKYHLIQRSRDFKIGFLLEYFPNQLAVFSPFVFIPAIIILIKNRARDLMERAYYFIIWGFLIFFLFTAFRGHVEPHWTVAATVPMLVIFYTKLTESDYWRKYTGKWVFYSLGLIAIARILIASPFLPPRIGFSGKEVKHNSLNKVFKDTPIVFTGSFQDPSLYQFFNNKPAVTLSHLDVRTTQFDIWKYEEGFFGKKVFVAREVEGRSKEIYFLDYRKITGFFVEKFQAPNRLQIEFEPIQNLKENNELKISIHNPGKHEIDFNHAELPVKLQAVFTGENENIYEPVTMKLPISIIKPGETLNSSVTFNTKRLPKGTYGFGITAKSDLGSGYNSEFIKVEKP